MKCHLLCFEKMLSNCAISQPYEKTHLFLSIMVIVWLKFCRYIVLKNVDPALLINRKDQVVTKWWSLQRLTFAYTSNTSPTFGSKEWKKCWVAMSCPQGKFCNKEIPEAYRCGFLFSMGIFPTSPGVYHPSLKTIVQVASQSCFIGSICCRANKWHSAQTPRLYQFTVFCTVQSWKALPDQKSQNWIELNWKA